MDDENLQPAKPESGNSFAHKKASIAPIHDDLDIKEVDPEEKNKQNQQNNVSTPEKSISEQLTEQEESKQNQHNYTAPVQPKPSKEKRKIRYGLYIITAVLSLNALQLFLLGSELEGQAQQALRLFGTLAALLSFGLLFRYEWARIMTVGLCLFLAVGSFNNFVLLIVYISVILYLTVSDVKDEF